MKWIGAHIWDLVSRFRSNVYIEDSADLTVDGISSDGWEGAGAINNTDNINGAFVFADSSGRLFKNSNYNYIMADGSMHIKPPIGGADITIAASSTGTLTLKAGGGIRTEGMGLYDVAEIRLKEADMGGSEYVGFKPPTLITTNCIWTLPSADGTIGQTLSTNGSKVLSWVDNGSSDGWHGSTSKIKILFSDFIGDDGGRPSGIINDSGAASEEFFVESYSSNPMYVTKVIPQGYKATHVMIYGSATDAVEVWEREVDSKTGVSKGTGNVDTEITLSAEVTSGTKNYLFIHVDNASGNEVYGGYITIAAV
jgi:hypothetical protein